MNAPAVRELDCVIIEKKKRGGGVSPVGAKKEKVCWHDEAHYESLLKL